MNKQEYMYNLFEALRPFEEEVRDEIISDYEEHFSMGLAAGKTEEQIVEELGSIDELIADLNDLKNGSKKEEKTEKTWTFDSREFSEGAEKVAKGFANFFGSIMGKATNGAEKMGESVADGFSTFADGFSNVAEKVFDKSNEFAKEVSDGFRAARGEEARDEESQNLGENVEMEGGDVCNLKVETDCGDIFIKKSEDDKIRVTYKNYGTPNQLLAFKFKCYKVGRNTLVAKASRQYGNATFFRSLSSPKIEVYVEVPKKMESIVINSASGMVNAEEIASEYFKVNDVSGRVNFTLCEAGKVVVNNVSGCVNSANCKFGSVSMQTVSGSINAGADASEVKLSTTSGAIRLEGKGFQKVKGGSVSGSVHIKLYEADGFNASAASTSGAISLTCGESHINGSRSGNYVLGNGSAKMNVSTVSGSITIECDK